MAPQTLHRINAYFAFGQQSVPRVFSYNNFPFSVDAHHGRQERRTVRPRNSLRRASLRIHVRDQAVRRPQIDSHYPAHDSPSTFLTTPRQFPAARHPLNFECNFVGSTLRSSASATPSASLHPRPNRVPHPTAPPAPPAPHPLPSISPENFPRPHPAARAVKPPPRPTSAPRAIRPATHSTRKLLPVIPAAPAAWWSLPCAHSEIPADTPPAIAAPPAPATTRLLPTIAAATNSARTRWPAQNCPDAASSSACETAHP